jgi:hypothetical protein
MIGSTLTEGAEVGGDLPAVALDTGPDAARNPDELQFLGGVVYAIDTGLGGRDSSSSGGWADSGGMGTGDASDSFLKAAAPQICRHAGVALETTLFLSSALPYLSFSAA